MDEQLHAAIKRLMGNSDFRRWIDYVRSRKEEATELGMDTEHPPHIYRYQGAREALDNLISDVERVHDVPAPQKTRPIV